MTSLSVKIGLVGCGAIAQQVHLDTLRAHPNAEISAFAEIDEDRRDEVQRRIPNSRAFADYQDLLSESDVEAVLICLPTALHSEAAIQAFEAGKHVYLEKPIATNRQEAEAVVEAGQRTATVGMMGFNYRFSELHQSAKKTIQKGEIGDPVMVRTVFSTARNTLPAWKTNRASGGGVLLDLGSHHVDQLRFLFEEEIAEVSAQRWSEQTEHDSATLFLRLTSGLAVQSFFSHRASTEDRIEVYGRDGKIALDRYTSSDIEITSPDFEYGRIPKLKRELQHLVRGVRRVIQPPGEPSFQAALATFIAACRGETIRYPDFEDGYRSLSIIEAAEHSATTERPVQPTIH